MNRRDFARLLAIGGAAPFLSPNAAWPRSLDLPPTPASPDEKFWMSVRDQFVMPKELTMLNAANLCPSSGPVLETMYRLTKDMDQSMIGKNVILVEDILDTGLTMTYLKKLLMARQPKSFRIAALLDKPSRRKQPIQADYVGFSIPDEFVVGYGLDYAEKYRNLPDICVVPREG